MNMIWKTVIVILLLFVSGASAYNLPADKAPVDWHPTEFEVIKLALFEYDNGNHDPWVLDVLEDANWHYTRSGRGQGYHAELREYISSLPE